MYLNGLYKKLNEVKDVVDNNPDIEFASVSFGDVATVSAGTVDVDAGTLEVGIHIDVGKQYLTGTLFLQWWRFANGEPTKFSSFTNVCSNLLRPVADTSSIVYVVQNRLETFVAELISALKADDEVDDDLAKSIVDFVVNSLLDAFNNGPYYVSYGNKEFLETVADMEDVSLPVVKKTDDGSFVKVGDLSDLKKAFLLGEEDKLIFIKEDI